MIYRNINDYEAIYIYKYWHSEVALNVLMDKYTPLIRSRLTSFRIRESHYEDFFQECEMSLFRAITLFDEKFDKTFTKYVELVITRKIIKLLKDDNKKSYDLAEYLPETRSYYDVISEFWANKKVLAVKDLGIDDFKMKIFKEIIIGGMDEIEFAEKHNCPLKQVYNHLYSLRIILKKSDIFK